MVNEAEAAEPTDVTEEDASTISSSAGEAVVIDETERISR